MSEILDRLFPEEQQPENVLAGLPDFTHGIAEEYFRSLDIDSRELVQWYLMQGMTPPCTGVYAHDLGTGYAVVDPNRTSSGGMLSAHAELARIKQYLEIFVKSPDFFPKLGFFNVAVRNEDGFVEGSADVEGWTRFSSKPVVSLIIQDTLDRTMVLIDMVDGFIDDPLAAPGLLNQELILQEHREAALSSESI